jgi:hypothetical protein
MEHRRCCCGNELSNESDWESGCGEGRDATPERMVILKPAGELVFGRAIEPPDGSDLPGHESGHVGHGRSRVGRGPETPVEPVHQT